MHFLPPLVLPGFSCLSPPMSDQPQPLRPANPRAAGVRPYLALHTDGKKVFKLSHEMMAKITAAHLIEQLSISGFVVMKTPPARSHGEPVAGHNKHLTD